MVGAKQEDAMPVYEVRLYKKASGPKNMHTMVDRIEFEAVDDADAIVKAPEIQIPKFDDSDYAILFGQGMHTLWRLDA